ncbi:MAG: SPOR domain-containing protein [Halieaceae bacterium]
MRVSLLSWCILAALIANVVVYLWPPEKRQASVSEPPPGIRSLVLLEEMEPSVAAETRLIPETVAVETEQAIANTLAETAADSAANNATDNAAESTPANPAAPDGDELQEIRITAQRLSLPQRCWLAGPVEDNELSERLNADFAAAAISMDLILQTVAAPPDHWVYLPAPAEQTEVRRLARELREAGIDNFPITDGALAGSLSLGLFRSEERAVAVREKVRGQGYPAEIYRRPRSREEAWIALDDAGREALEWPDTAGLLAGYEGLQLRQRDCPVEELLPRQ